MGQLMLLNPKARAGGRKKPRTAAQKAATKKMLSANRARRGGHKANYKKRKAANTVSGYFPNPAPKRRKNRARVGIARVTRRRRNPIGLSGNSLMNMGMTSIQGAAGALIVNTVVNYLPLPPSLKAGNGKYLVRAGVAIAVGVFGKKVMSQKIATNMAVGTMTVALHDLMLGIAAKAIPSLQLGDVGDYQEYYGGDVDSGVAQYLPSGMAGMYDTYDTAGNVGEYVS